MWNANHSPVLEWMSRVVCQQPHRINVDRIKCRIVHRAEKSQRIDQILPVGELYLADRPVASCGSRVTMNTNLFGLRASDEVVVLQKWAVQDDVCLQSLDRSKTLHHPRCYERYVMRCQQTRCAATCNQQLTACTDRVCCIWCGCMSFHLWGCTFRSLWMQIAGVALLMWSVPAAASGAWYSKMYYYLPKMLITFLELAPSVDSWFTGVNLVIRI